MANIVVSALATFNGKALKKGQKDISAFDKQAQKLGRTFTRVFAATALVAFGKKAVSAFAADEKAAKSLAVQLENTGNAFRVAEVEAYIGNLQKLYKVLDDELRPAFQTLLNATGSVTLSQQALETALNVAVGTGNDLASVVSAIAQGATGTTTAISRLKTGLDKATIASGDMNKIMAALDAKFKGQALARLNTYAGKMDTLKIAAADATEIIGKGLVDALSAFGKDNSIDQAADSMYGFAVAIANVTTGIGELAADIKKLVDSDVGKFLLTVAALIGLPKKILVAGAVGVIANDIGQSNKTAQNVGGYSGILDLRTAQALLKARKEEFRIINNKNALENKNVEELKKKFDLERIGLTAALNSATDEETKLRLRAQLAILDNNEALAKKILAEMEATEGLRKFTQGLETSTNKYDAMMMRLVDTFTKTGSTLNEARALAGMSTRLQAQADAYAAGTLTFPTPTFPTTTVQPLNKIPAGAINPQQQFTSAAISADLLIPATIKQSEAIMSSMSARLQAQADAYFAQNNLQITVNAGSDKLSQAIAESLQIAQRSGFSTSANGSLP